MSKIPKAQKTMTSCSCGKMMSVKDKMCIICQRKKIQAQRDRSKEFESKRMDNSNDRRKEK